MPNKKSQSKLKITVLRQLDWGTDWYRLGYSLQYIADCSIIFSRIKPNIDFSLLKTLVSSILQTIGNSGLYCIVLQTEVYCIVDCSLRSLTKCIFPEASGGRGESGSLGRGEGSHNRLTGYHSGIERSQNTLT